MRLDDFCITNQMGGNAGTDSDYAWNYCYLRPYTVGWRDSKEMFKTMDRISKGMEKLAAKIGQPVTYGQFVARVATVIGVSAIRFYDETDRKDFQDYLPGNAVHKIDHTVKNEVARLNGRIAA